MSFTTTFTVDRPPAEVFAAVTNVRGWWSAEIEGGTSAFGDEFDYHMRDLHRCRIRVTDVVPDREVAWLVLDNQFAFTTDKSEWTGTTVTWGLYLGTSLRELITTGTGRPNADGTHQVPEEAVTR